jgi:hypothetical protein
MTSAFQHRRARRVQTVSTPLMKKRAFLQRLRQ